MITRNFLHVCGLAIVLGSLALPATADTVNGSVGADTAWSNIGGFFREVYNGSNFVFLSYPGQTVPGGSGYPAWWMNIDPGVTTTLDVALGSDSPVHLDIQNTGTLTMAFNGTSQFIRTLETPNQGINNYGTINIPLGNIYTYTDTPDNSLLNQSSGDINLTGTGTLTFNQSFQNNGLLTLGGANTAVIGAPGAGNVPFDPTIGNAGTISGGGSLGTALGTVGILNYTNGLIDANSATPLQINALDFAGLGIWNVGGTVKVEAGSELDLFFEKYTQTDGNTKVLGTLNSAHELDIEGGKIGGSGAINAPVNLSGTGILDPGDPQTTTINGAFNMSGGSIYLNIFGTDPSDYDHIIFEGPTDFTGGEIDLNIPLNVDLNGHTLSFFDFDGSLPGGTLPAFHFVNGQNYQITPHLNEAGTTFSFSGNTVTGSSVPEPATWTFMAAGILWAATRLRRKA